MPGMIRLQASLRTKLCVQNEIKKPSNVRKRILLIAAVIAVAGAMVFGGTAVAGDARLRTGVEADLSGAAEVPPGTGDADGTGHIQIGLYPVKNKICYTITVNDITLPATAAHLHEAPAGSEGPVRLGLKASGADGTARECRRGLSSGFIREIKRNRENYYVNVHTSDFQDGAVRGQLRLED